MNPVSAPLARRRLYRPWAELDRKERFEALKQQEQPTMAVYQAMATSGCYWRRRPDGKWEHVEVKS